MKNRLALCAVTGLTALVALGDLLLVLSLPDAPAYHSAMPANRGYWLLEHRQVISAVKLSASVSMLLWWLAATITPAHRPYLRLANAAYSGWLAIQLVMVWATVLDVLHQVAGFPGDLTGRQALMLLESTDLGWLVSLTLCLPALQLALGEFAYRSGRPALSPIRPTSPAEAT
ncbi:hypothetical protein EGJ13_01870 [Stutzerimonas stutzeri]|uniref:hypothetical protein n=1 Tax=Stutzerimonas stutzeri TaxID=316 RepID=UPI000F76AA10|nr:hypothetical protein [Stutzerimonas stutzeri]RRV88293.1 hypothetical protein EGJ13_01870 [Stutzerimonas stutzeri]RRV98225.1 hypothetical protein EGJ21_00785 [Stutzerimonas stutzeri]RRW00072.1 hypothetical protein EGJ17_01865 [Stutzerimonas stutzeri]RRW02613.1 hypothetical protein EGJ14_00780 [Stutzerimonas stutzeri]RRW09560.1 hypothetical protein EGJ32_02460 [Stutzerimonas stutzeri]